MAMKMESSWKWFEGMTLYVMVYVFIDKQYLWVDNLAKLYNNVFKIFNNTKWRVFFSNGWIQKALAFKADKIK